MYICLLIDMQLYIVACQIMSDAHHYVSVWCHWKAEQGVRCRGPHCRFIWSGILNGKSWVRSLRAFRVICEAVLSDFFSTGPKTSEELKDYIERSREHPTGRHWVDNLIGPTHQPSSSCRTRGRFIASTEGDRRSTAIPLRIRPFPLCKIPHSARIGNEISHTC